MRNAALITMSNPTGTLFLVVDPRTRLERVTSTRAVKLIAEAWVENHYWREEPSPTIGVRP